jgi:hypothetical protein
MGGWLFLECRISLEPIVYFFGTTIISSLTISSSSFLGERDFALGATYAEDLLLGGESTLAEL